ncbi:MAG: hypothetical protein K6E30_08740 [Lachnospiraceae bacterium]|nr:hypothetical protein [Lachnospiraceae bacterium]
MYQFLLYPAVLLGFLILFLAAGGGLGVSAAFLNRRFLSGLGLSDQVVKISLIILLVSDLLAAAASGKAYLEDTAREGYLLREEYGGAAYSEQLHAKTPEEEADLTVEVAPRKYSVEEASAMLDRAEEGIRELVLSGQAGEHVSGDLHFAETFPDLPVSILWNPSDPDLVDWEGRIGRSVPADGVLVTVTADLFFEGETVRHDEEAEDMLFRTVVLELTVFPKEETFGSRLAWEAEEADRDPESGSKDRLLLPEELDGQPLSWRTSGKDGGPAFLFLGLLASVVFLFAEKSSREEKEEKRRASMVLDYPLITGKLVLLIRAGMSVRGAFGKIAGDYRTGLSEGGLVREGCALIEECYYAMANGTPESVVYSRLAEEAPVREYRTLGLLLSRNLRKGSDEIVRLLELEENEAFEERKKSARILGEQAETKMLFPMMLLLMVVFALLMVPAMLNFG